MLQLSEGDAEIERENLQSMGVVSARLENRDLGSTMKEIQSKLSTQVHLPQGYHIEYGGAYAAAATIIYRIIDDPYCFQPFGFWCNSFFIQRCKNCIGYSDHCCFGNFRKLSCFIYNRHAFECWKLYRTYHDRWNYWGKFHLYFSAIQRKPA